MLVMAFSWLVSLNQPHMQVLKFSDQANWKSEFGLLLLEAPSNITYCLVWPGHSMVDQQTRCFIILVAHVVWHHIGL